MGLASAEMRSPSYTRTEDMKVRVIPKDEAGNPIARSVRDRFRIVAMAVLSGAILKVLGVPKQGSDGYPYVKGLKGRTGILTWTITILDPRTKKSVTVSKSWRQPWPVHGSSKDDMGVVEAPEKSEACATPEPTPDSGTPA